MKQINELLLVIRYLLPTKLRQLTICSSELKDLRDSLKDVADIVENLRLLGQKLRDGLDQARSNLTDAKTECDKDEASKTAGACDKIPAGDPLQAEADFNKVRTSYISDITTKIERHKMDVMFPVWTSWRNDRIAT